MQDIITQSHCQAMIFETAPGFQAFWQAHLAESETEQEPPSACRFFSLFADYVHHSLTENQALAIADIFQLIERIIRSGDDEVKTAATTCFLENLQNKQTPPAAWVPWLGAASRDYCRAWDEFTGVATPGLWPDGMPPGLNKTERLNIDLNEAMAQIFTLDPAFKLFWQQHSKLAEQPDEPGKKAIYHLALLAKYVHLQIKSDSAYHPGPLLDLLEHFNSQGNDALRTSVAAGFTENLFNQKTPPERWMVFLGPSMQAYAQSWAEIIALTQKDR